MQIIRAAAVVCAIAGPICLWLITSAACREVPADGGFTWSLLCWSAVIVLISAGLVALCSWTLAGKLWAYYAMVALIGSALGFSIAQVLKQQPQNWFSVVAPAIFFGLAIGPLKQYRDYARSRAAR